MPTPLQFDPMSGDPAHDHPIVMGIAGLFVEIAGVISSGDELPLSTVVRGQHVAFLELGRQLVGSVGLVDWLRSSADVIEMQVLAAQSVK